MHKGGGGGGSSKSVYHVYKEEGGSNLEVVRKNVPFCTCFVIFSYAGKFYHISLCFASAFISVL